MLHWNNDRFLAAPRKNRTWSRPVAGARGRDGGAPLHRSPAIPCSRSAAEGWRIYSGPSSTLPKVNLTIWSRPPKLLRALLQIEVPADDESPIEVTAVPEITCCEGIYHASTTHLFFFFWSRDWAARPVGTYFWQCFNSKLHLAILGLRWIVTMRVNLVLLLYFWQCFISKLDL
jgi:hypothetical protein